MNRYEEEEWNREEKTGGLKKKKRAKREMLEWGKRKGKWEEESEQGKEKRQ